MDDAAASASESRVDGPAKVSGRAQYSSDLALPGQLVGAVLRSPHPHARVISVDTSRAAQLDGVEAIVTAEDLDLTWYEEDVPFFSSTARYVGDEIAAVAAIDELTARRALRLIEVTYDVLDHVSDFERAAERTTWEDDEWEVAEPTVTERGDLSALDDAAVRLSGEFRTPTAVHNALETHGSVAQWVDDRLTVYVSTQGVNAVREKVADVFGLDHNQVRVVAEHVGGGFGAKQVPWKNTILAAELSRRTARPVRLFLDRNEENLAVGKRGATLQRVTIGAKSDGELVGIEVEAIADGGAYRMGGESADLSGPYLHLYRCPNVRTSMRTVYTHTGPAIAFRAPGYVESTFALESMMDMLAAELDIDPIELRLRNYTERDQQQDLPWSSPDALRRSYASVADAAGRPSDQTDSDSPDVLVGRGFAAHEWLAGAASPPGYAWMELNPDGSIHAATAAQDIGTGTRTALTQVVADILSTDPDRVRLTLGDTAAGPPAPTSAGSMTIPTMAPALAAAAEDMRRQILARAAQHLHVPAGELALEGERVVAAESGDSIELVDLLESLEPTVLRSEGGLVHTAADVSVRTFGSAIADVAVDTRTGQVRVRRLVVAPDCGRILNPLLVESQVIGGAIQGIGFALTERQVVDHTIGRVLNPQLEDYLVPTVLDGCEIVHAEVDLPDTGANALGVKGIGELPLIPVPAAIANAVSRALGVRQLELPITPKVVLAALAQRSRNETGTHA